MGKLVFQATAGGQVALVGPNPSSNFSLNVPAVNATLATTAGNTFTAQQVDQVDASINGLTVGKGGGSVASATVFGSNAALATNTGANLTAIGLNSGRSNTSGADNTFVGANSAYNTTTGSSNSAFGKDALNANTTGGSNTAIGFQALAVNSTASNNTAVGYQALYSNSTGASSTAFGYQAGYNQTTAGAGGGYNAYFGYRAGYALTTGYYNTLVGTGAGSGITTGVGNTIVGATGASFNAGDAITTGSKNTILGNYSGNNGGLDIRTSSNYIVLSDGDGNPRGIFDNTGAFLTAGATSSSNTTLGIKLTPDAVFGANIVSVVGSATSGSFTGFNLYSTGSSSQRFYADYGGTLHAVSTSIAAISDQSLKENVVDIEPSLDKVMSLRPVRFDWKQEMQIEQKQIQGFIAQEVEIVLPDLVYDYQYNDTEIKKSIKMGDMIPTLVKAIQELNAEVTTQAAEIAALKAKLGA